MLIDLPGGMNDMAKPCLTLPPPLLWKRSLNLLTGISLAVWWKITVVSLRDQGVFMVYKVQPRCCALWSENPLMGKWKAAWVFITNRSYLEHPGTWPYIYTWLFQLDDSESWPTKLSFTLSKHPFEDLKTPLLYSFGASNRWVLGQFTINKNTPLTKKNGPSDPVPWN